MAVNLRTAWATERDPGFKTFRVSSSKCRSLSAECPSSVEVILSRNLLGHSYTSLKSLPRSLGTGAATPLKVAIQHNHPQLCGRRCPSSQSPQDTGVIQTLKSRKGLYQAINSVLFNVFYVIKLDFLRSNWYQLTFSPSVPVISTTFLKLELLVYP